MKNKIIAFDLDGTLLRSDCMPSDYSTDIIKQLKNEGYTLIITTGRSWIGAQKIYEKLELNTPIVLLNGMTVMIPQTNEILFDKCIILYELDLCYFNFSYNLYKYVYSLNVLFDYTCSTFLMDLNERYTNYFTKADGIKYILEYYHKTSNDLVFFGDGENDLEIMKLAGLGIAMSNAINDLKKIAARITDYDHEHDGCIKFLLRLILEHKKCLVIKKNVKGHKFKQLLSYLLENSDSFSWKFPICSYITPEEANEIIIKQLSMVKQSKDLINKLDVNDKRRKTLEKVFSQPIDDDVFKEALKQKINQYNQNVLMTKVNVPQDFIDRSFAARVQGTFLKEYMFFTTPENITDLLCISQMLSGLNVAENVVMKSLAFYRKEQLIFEVFADINMARIFLYDDEIERFKSLKIKTVSVEEV